MDGGSDSISLFSYGTLRQENVQQATFGRLLQGRPDSLPGFVLVPLPIDDAYVVETSGLAVHSIARPTDDPGDLIPGILFEITQRELEAADRYEVSDVKRIEAVLASGAIAHVYVDGRA
jgi:hypothetical protein